MEFNGNDRENNISPTFLASFQNEFWGDLLEYLNTTLNE